jgi:tRNA nucleotidyltransferase (CCA-adding enzyme)
MAFIPTMSPRPSTHHAALPRACLRPACCLSPPQPAKQHLQQSPSGANAVAAAAVVAGAADIVRDLDVVLCHSTADFDSLAAAVGLAKLRGPDTIVVVPGGEAPSLKRFLTLHRQLYRISDTKNIDPRRLRWVGVVDTCRLERLGVASTWPGMADSVIIYDHHIGRVCDVKARPGGATKVIVEPVGAVATLICEKLRASDKVMTPAEATLLALAIHSDTGSLTYEHSTPRDAASLSWLMEQGAIQRSIAEFSHSLLTNEQQLMLSRTLSQLKRVPFRGVVIGSVVVVGNSFIKGMSAVATDLLDLSNVDIIIFTYVNCRGRRAANSVKRRKPPIDLEADQGNLCGPDELKQVSVICRARARTDGVDFRVLLKEIGGGGHPRAASASLKLTEADAEELTKRLVEHAMAQIPEPVQVSMFMTTEVVSAFRETTLSSARDVMIARGHNSLPIVDVETNRLLGIITLDDVNAAAQKGGNDSLRRPVSGWMRQQATRVGPGMFRLLFLSTVVVPSSLSSENLTSLCSGLFFPSPYVQ